MTIDSMPHVLRAAVDDLRAAQRRLRVLLHQLDVLATRRGGYTRDAIEAERWLLAQHFQLERLALRATVYGNKATSLMTLRGIRAALAELRPLLERSFDEGRDGARSC
jgi:hypothetical protein